MSNVDRLFAEYIAEHRAGGEADPVTYMDRAKLEERHELAALLDGYLARAERAPFDEQALGGSAAEGTIDALERALAGSSGLWPAVLPRLRARIDLKRSELVERLAVALGVTGQREKVATYYNAMEHGTLDATGVSGRVIEALGEILGERAEALRELGRSLGATSSDSGSAPVFTRQTGPAPVGPTEPTGQSDDAWDEVDELFRGGH